MKLEGLFLWGVPLRGSDESLWITTKRNCIHTALRKANRFLSRNRRRYPRVSVRGVQSHGTLDA